MRRRSIAQLSGVIATACFLIVLQVSGAGAALSGDELQKFWLDAYGAQIQCPVNPIFEQALLEKAPPDGCFYGPGDERNSYQGPAFDPEACMADGGWPKVNQAYVWGLTHLENQIWFGTASNVLCLVLGGYLGRGNPMEVGAWTCEFGASQFSPPVPAAYGDWRPPPDVFL
jgi:hypothetical protein